MVTTDTNQTGQPPPHATAAVVTPNSRTTKMVLSAWAPPFPPPPLFPGPQALQDLAGLDRFLLFPEEPQAQQLMTTTATNYNDDAHHDQDHSSSSSFRMTSSKKDLFQARCHEEDSVSTTGSNSSSNMKNGNWWRVVQSLQRAIADARGNNKNNHKNDDGDDNGSGAIVNNDQFLDVAELLCTGYQSERQTVWALQTRIHELEEEMMIRSAPPTTTTTTTMATAAEEQDEPPPPTTRLRPSITSRTDSPFGFGDYF
jgi:hypothetical protein